METYARSIHQLEAHRIEISRESLITLLQRMRDSGKSAWVRLQVVRAVEFYQKSVLQSAVPDLSDVRTTLESLARKERAEKHGSERNSGHSGAEPVEAKLLGVDRGQVFSSSDSRVAPSGSLISTSFSQAQGFTRLALQLAIRDIRIAAQWSAGLRQTNIQFFRPMHAGRRSASSRMLDTQRSKRSSL